MLDISIEETDLTVSVVAECIYMYSDLLDIYENVSECVHYSYMCESTGVISDGIEKIKSGLKDIFTRFKNFIKTITDKLIYIFTKKSRANNIRKERLRKIIDSEYIVIEPFKISTYNYSFANITDHLFNIAYNESEKITKRINGILNDGQNDDMYSRMNALKDDLTSEEYFNKLRQGIIISFMQSTSVNIAPVQKSEYIQKLESVLRGGTITKSEIEITKTLLIEIIKSDDEQIKIRKNLEKYKNDMLVMFDRLENDFNKAIKVISDETWKIDSTVNKPMKNSKDIRVFDNYQFDYSKKLLDSLNSLFSTSIVYFKNLSDIISIALAEYSKAVTESMDINNEIFSIALNKIERVMYNEL